jgi:hypothetical protein
LAKVAGEDDERQAKKKNGGTDRDVDPAVNVALAVDWLSFAASGRAIDACRARRTGHDGLHRDDHGRTTWRKSAGILPFQSATKVMRCYY